MTCQDSFHEVAFNISFWTRNISSARILFWRGVYIEILADSNLYKCLKAAKCSESRVKTLQIILDVIESN